MRHVSRNFRRGQRRSSRVSSLVNWNVGTRALSPCFENAPTEWGGYIRIRCLNFVDARPGEARLGFAYENFELSHCSVTHRGCQRGAASGNCRCAGLCRHHCGFTDRLSVPPLSAVGKSGRARDFISLCLDRARPPLFRKRSDLRSRRAVRTLCGDRTISGGFSRQPGFARI